MAGYNFTDRVRRTLQAAREASEELRSGYVGPEHLLVAVLRHADRETLAALQALNLSPEALLEQFVPTLAPGKAAIVGPDLPYTNKGKQVLEAAMSEAAGLRHTYVGTEHLLLGLTITPSLAADFLRQAGVDHGRLRTVVLEILGSAPPGSPVVAAPNRPWTTTSTARVALIVAVDALIVALVALFQSLKAT